MNFAQQIAHCSPATSATIGARPAGHPLFVALELRLPLQTLYCWHRAAKTQLKSKMLDADNFHISVLLANVQLPFCSSKSNSLTKSG